MALKRVDVSTDRQPGFGKNKEKDMLAYFTSMGHTMTKSRKRVISIGRNRQMMAVIMTIFSCMEWMHFRFRK